MHKLVTTLAILALTCHFLCAGPARKGSFPLIQPDGSKITATLVGDEFGHVLMTEDGCAVVQDEDGWYCYAVYSPDGTRRSSGVRVGRDNGSAASQSRFVPYDAIRDNAIARRASIQSIQAGEKESILKRIRDYASLTKSDGTAQKHGLVILAQFGDCSFTYSRQDFVNLLSQEGYNVNGATGSAKEYFDDQFNGQVEFSFTVSEIVSLPRYRSYYGANNSYGNDVRPAQMIADACELADDHIDFSIFDDDGDGTVDNVFVFYAGMDEAEGGGENCIWAHAWYMYSAAGISLVLDGVRIDRYACASELGMAGYDNVTGNSVYNMAGIGTFCHEYSHTFGLPDLYDTDYGSTVAAGTWTKISLMDGGNYNNSGNTPPYYTAIEREHIGMSEPEMITGPGSYVLEPVHENGRYLRMDTDTEGEYFLFECRVREGWDTYINNDDDCGGLLIYHIDKSSTRSVGGVVPSVRWTSGNSVNAYPEHQCADLVEADGRPDIVTSAALAASNLRGLFFPAGSTAYIPLGTPAFTYWSGAEAELALTDISFDGYQVSFNVVAAGMTSLPAATSISTTPFQDAAIISWSSSFPSSAPSWISVGDMEEIRVTPYETGMYCVVFEDLEPGTEYPVTITFSQKDGAPEYTGSFSTRPYRSENSYPYIYFGTRADSDGCWAAGTKIPLRVYNAIDAQSVKWELSGTAIEIGPDGYYELASEGELKATITHDDGSVEIITRYVRVK